MTPQTATGALSVRGLCKHFGGVAALSGVSIELRPGEVQGLIGPNGSGKTTLLNMLSGYYPIDEGSIHLGNEDLTRATVQRRACAGIARTFQTPRLLPTLSALENVMLGGWRDARAGMIGAMLSSPRARAEDKLLSERALELLCGVGLAHALDERADVLRHGEQRFLEIARALAARPRFVLLDEPAGGLSGNEIASLGAVLAALKDCGIGVLLVEHHTDFVFRICDRVTAIDFGRVIVCDTPDKVRAHEDVVRVYLGA
ncbi:ABC transporter ATP-binding protein [Verminephrobacter eiseniae]|uniref:ABC transporter ATP-binding protein n=1 Tax=Verminephrobacter eiseniae TaxID=364317 RepID=UPI0022380DEE|nr:ABC transporter ATP-binding protein [Verminephrobacter eiseniae]MCW5260076.1 ABC transporter ATP-binding protein [Verminephrobacter eiseniae]